MAGEWWLTEESPTPKVEDSAPPLPPPPNPQIRSKPESLAWKVVDTSEEDILDLHYTRIKNIVLALFVMVFLTAFFPPAFVLALPYGLYVLYSFFSAMDRLRGTMFIFGFLTPISLTLPAALSLGRHLALSDGCYPTGGWGCSNYVNSGPDFNGRLCLLPVFAALPFLPPMSELSRASLIVGMFYGLFMSVIVLFFSFIVGLMMWFNTT